MKKIIISAFVVIGLFFVLNQYIYNEKQAPDQVSLVGSDWVWVRTDLVNGTKVVPPDDSFVLSFDIDTVTSTTDCNMMNGAYVSQGEVLSFSPFAMTKKFCEGSFEIVYGQHLSLVNSYVVLGEELRFNLNRDFGTMVFRKK